MGTLRYFNGVIAVCDYDNAAADYERTIKLLLEFDSSNPNSSKSLKPLLASNCLFHGLWNSSPEDLEFARSSADDLRSLGFELPESDKPRLTLEALEECSLGGFHRKLLIVRQETMRIGELADSLQYLARLYLLANGDERSVFILPRIEYENYRMKPFYIDLPGYFVRFVTGQSLNANVKFSYDGKRSARVDIYGKIGRYLDDPDTGEEYEFRLKRIAAAYLLQALLNYTSTLPFSMDESIPMIKRDDSKRFTGILADLMLAGKVSACPWCGRPVLKLRESSKPFCRQSHQTRYIEKARSMLDGGRSVDEVSREFPYVQSGTIRGWASQDEPGLAAGVQAEPEGASGMQSPNAKRNARVIGREA